MKERTIQKEIRGNRLLINITQWEARVGKSCQVERRDNTQENVSIIAQKTNRGQQNFSVTSVVKLSSGLVDDKKTYRKGSSPQIFTTRKSHR